MNRRVIVLLLCCISGGIFGGLDNTRCIVKPEATELQMQAALDWVCGPGALDCTPIKPGGDHFYPDTVRNHLSWAANAYFQLHSDTAQSCDFGGIAELDCGGRTWERIRGVNMGGWLLLEPWITPSLFEQFKNKPPAATAVDEYTFWEILGPTEAYSQLSKHWQSWVTETDISLLASYGLNTLRVPVGYWVFGGIPPFVEAGIKELDRIIALAAKYNLSILIDLHGAPGSQNGFDNSGRTCGTCAGICPRDFTWPTNAGYINDTINVLIQITNRYATQHNVIGIEFLNEPRWDVNLYTIRDFYLRAYSAVRPLAPNWRIFIHDAFRYNVWQNFMPLPDYYALYMDTHIYQAFTEQDIKQPESGHLAQACGLRLTMDWMECMQFPTVVGEWSLGTSDCPEHLRGFLQPAQAPSFGVPCPHQHADQFLRDYANAQLNTWERSHGWFFWNFKTESAPYWSYIDGVKNGWIPPNVANLPPAVEIACNKPSV